ncbi:MAG: hypothetical protein ACOYM3_14040 [Terrimicrobiaceae bacterium]
MSYRTTFALDETTSGHLKRLAKLWQVSKAEVVRRAVAQAECSAVPDKPDPLVLLRAYHAKGGLDPARAEHWLRGIQEDRKHWRKQ